MSEDLISRQAAIDALCDNCDNPKAVCATYPCDQYKEIEAIPSAQRKGKWIYLTGLDAFECSVCGSSMVRNIFNYCPWCGADMKGEGDEDDNT